MLRRPLDLLVTSKHVGVAAPNLGRLGAATSEVHFEQTLPILKFGLRVADAIVIDTSGYGDSFSSAAVSGAYLAKEIHELPSSVTMPTGTRWNGVPISIIVGDENTAASMTSDPSLSFAVICSANENPIEYYPYRDPWIEIYARIDSAALANVLERMEQMQSIGHRFTNKDGRWVRAIAPNGKRRRGVRPELETELYCGPRDNLIGTRQRSVKYLSARHVVLIDTIAVQRDLDLYEHLVKRSDHESDFQRFYETRPYVLGAGAFETTAHPAFHPIGARAAWRPDLVQHSFNQGPRPKATRIIELKTPKTKLLTKSGSDWHWARNSSAGLAQTRRYADHAMAKENAQQMESLFGEVPARIEKLLIAGTSANYDSDRLNLAQRYDSDVQVSGYDEMSDKAVTRYSS